MEQLFIEINLEVLELFINEQYTKKQTFALNNLSHVILVFYFISNVNLYKNS